MEMKNYKLFFGFEKEPFGSDVRPDDILITQQLNAAKSRFAYTLDLGAVYLLTGEIGSGKSTAVRHLLNTLHPSETRIVYVTATTGSILELYKLILSELGITVAGISRAALRQKIKREVLESVGRKINTVLVVDEASLLRLEVFCELHTLCQFEMDAKPLLPLVLAGQANLIDKLMYPGSMPLASRIVAKSHFTGIDRKQMEEYLLHHLEIAGIKTMLFDDTAVTAIHQGSGGIYRKSNHLARGALVAASMNQQKSVNADHVRMAASEIF
jgi:general secretion pathway protein A